MVQSRCAVEPLSSDRLLNQFARNAVAVRLDAQRCSRSDGFTCLSPVQAIMSQQAPAGGTGYEQFLRQRLRFRSGGLSQVTATRPLWRSGGALYAVFAGHHDARPDANRSGILHHPRNKGCGRSSSTTSARNSASKCICAPLRASSADEQGRIMKNHIKRVPNPPPCRPR